MLEVEAKLRAQHAKVAHRLRGLGAPPGPERVQADRFFRHPQRDFAATDEALRLRVEAGVMELTYKGPREAGDTKVREEHNVPVGADPTPMLRALGFEEGPGLRKHRASATLGGCRVELDRVEGLGEFVEVEATGMDRAAAVAAVERTLHLLGLEDAPRVHQSYLELALAAGSGRD